MGVLVWYLVHVLVVRPFWLSPLRNVPGPYYLRVSQVPMLWLQYNHRWVAFVHGLHRAYGNVVVIGPSEVSCNGDDIFIHDIYVRNMPKLPFYKDFRLLGHDTIFSTLENRRHLQYKKLLRGPYTKLAIMRLQETRNLIKSGVQNLLGAIVQDTAPGHHPGSPQGTEVFSLFGSLALDVVSAFELGQENATSLLSHPSAREILHHIRVASSMSLLLFFPVLKWFSRGDSAQVDSWLRATLSSAQEHRLKNTLMETLMQSGLPRGKSFAFLSDNLIAGHETSAIALTYICYELSRPVNRGRQDRLRAEIRGVQRLCAGHTDIIDNLDQIDKLPFLDAVLNENFRVHTSGAGSMPRICPQPYTVETSQGKVVLPAGTTISCQAYSYHRQSDIFPNPHHWIPERWLQGENESADAYKSRRATMQKQMLAFGKGVRMCLGKDLAICEIKMAVANLYARMQSEVSPSWCTVTHYDKAASCGHPVDLLSNQQKPHSDEEKMAMLDGLSVKPRCEECYLVWLPV